VLVTNGFLIDETMAEKIAHSGLDVASISLDSLDANIHDFLRGQRGAHQRVMQAIGYLDKFGAKSVSILTVIMGPNIDSLIGLAEWINGNYRLSSIYFKLYHNLFLRLRIVDSIKKKNSVIFGPKMKLT